MGMEVCCTLGMLDAEQAQQLKEAGLTAYNHNLDTSREYYPKIITTRTYDDRLETIENVRQAGISVCSGGIIGMGEKDEDRVGVSVRSAAPWVGRILNRCGRGRLGIASARCPHTPSPPPSF